MSCRSETCCPAVSNYRADAVVSGECIAPTVRISPSDGSMVIVPTLVALQSSVEGATIYYTTDGTTPTTESTVYTAPFEIDSISKTVKAFAVVEGCDAGAVATATYATPSPESWQFSYSCATGDHAGAFGVFEPNGQANDYQFLLQFTLAGEITIHEITVLQTDDTGFWNSGQSWSNQEFIYPYADPLIPFHTYPLVVIDALNGDVQLNFVYGQEFNYDAGDYEWQLWGQPFTTLGGYFLCIITLTDGRVVKRLIDTTCVPPPPPCTNPDPPSVVGACDPKVTVTFTADDDWKIYRRTSGGGEWQEIADGAAGVVSYEDTDVERCASYDYYIERVCDEVYYASTSVSVTVPCQCTIILDANDTEICNGDEVTIDFIGQNCTGSIAWGTDGEGGSFTDTGVLSGAITVSPSTTTTYTFRGSSVSCGDFYASVTITVDPCLPPSTCVPSDFENTYQFDGNQAAILADYLANCSILPRLVTGSGLMTRTTGCNWIGYFEIATGSGFNLSLSLNGSAWHLRIDGQEEGDEVPVWIGIKTTGLTPVGTYTRVSECLTTASFTVS